MNQLNFRISSALKNIIGQELITNKYVAIFELVKNAYDASAGKVEVIFENDKIIIKDNGKGMSLNDIKNKWLFVWYSAKADDSENEGYVNYRNKIETRKSFAGAKGVGRFACDRLGAELRLISLKDSPDVKVESILVSWDDFEIDSKKEFMDIKVQHESLPLFKGFNWESGTILEISTLREDWSDKDIEKLKRHLSRLINPNKDEQDVFDIYLSFKGIKEKVENFIFEKLWIKTTQIQVEISWDWKTISTELIDRGERIYKIIEKNEMEQSLFWIRFVLFYLNPPAKTAFKIAMGITTSDYWSISLYKNWFRVFPFWESGEDLLGLDKRKGQGYARFLGTRELLGKIEINNNSHEFKETSSRDWGLIETSSYKDLKNAFIEKCLRRLETYVVDTLDWTFRNEDGEEFFPKDRTEQINSLLEKLTKSKSYVDLEYGYKFEEKLNEQTNRGYVWATERLKDEARKTGNKGLEQAVKKIEESFERKTEENKNFEVKNEQLKKQAVSLMSLTSIEFDNLISYHHQISICTDTINNYIDLIFQKIQKGDTGKIEEYLQKMKKENSRIASIAWFATKNWMKEKATKTEKNLIKFIEDYIKENGDFIAGWKVKFDISWDVGEVFQFNFRPFDVAVVFDNLIKNSKVAEARKIDIFIQKLDSNSLKIIFSDNWKWFDGKIENLDDIFERKFSTTNWSGWGLFHVKQILEELKSTISVEKNTPKWAIFNINFLR